MRSVKINLLNAAFAVAIILLPARAVLADELDYTLTGVASGTITGNTNATFSNVAITISFTEDPATLNDTLGAGYYAYDDIGGSFTEGGYATTLTGVNLEVNSNADTGIGNYETVFLFNSDVSGSIGISENPALLGYALATPVTTGIVTGSDIGAFVGDGFSTSTGDTVQFTGLDSLDFTVTDPSAVPEPSTLILLVGALSVAGLLRYRFNR